MLPLRIFAVLEPAAI